MQFAKNELVNIGDEIEIEKDRLLERVSHATTVVLIVRALHKLQRTADGISTEIVLIFFNLLRYFSRSLWH